MPKTKTVLKKQSQKKLLENIPICFNESVDVVNKLTAAHPLLTEDLKKSLLKFLANVEKISIKHSVGLGFETYFVLTEGAGNGK